MHESVSAVLAIGSRAASLAHKIGSHHGTQKKLSLEAVQLYNEFIHGDINHPDFMGRVQKFAINGLTAAVILCVDGKAANPVHIGIR